MTRSWMCGCAALLFAGTLVAHEGEHRQHWSLDEVDTDKDGFITLAEAQANAPQIAERFQAIDRDKDGQVSRDELKASHRTTFEKRIDLREKFKEADADGDSRLTRDEAAKLPFIGEHFADLDKDGDGYVTKEEIGKGKRIYRKHPSHEAGESSKPSETL
jgi:Ca2+-binding EF-hand superfamily protein